MKRTTLAIVIVIAALAALILYSTLRLGGYSCEVCMEFAGRTACRTARGTSEQEARRTATDNACALLASGVTDSIACTNTPPRSARCEAKR